MRPTRNPSAEARSQPRKRTSSANRTKRPGRPPSEDTWPSSRTSPSSMRSETIADTEAGLIEVKRTRSARESDPRSRIALMTMLRFKPRISSGVPRLSGIRLLYEVARRFARVEPRARSHQSGYVVLFRIRSGPAVSFAKRGSRLGEGSGLSLIATHHERRDNEGCKELRLALSSVRCRDKRGRPR